MKSLEEAYAGLADYYETPKTRLAIVLWGSGSFSLVEEDEFRERHAVLDAKRELWGGIRAVYRPKRKAA